MDHLLFPSSIRSVKVEALFWYQLYPQHIEWYHSVVINIHSTDVSWINEWCEIPTQKYNNRSASPFYWWCVRSHRKGELSLGAAVRRRERLASLSPWSSGFRECWAFLSYRHSTGVKFSKSLISCYSAISTFWKSRKTHLSPVSCMLPVLSPSLLSALGLELHNFQIMYLMDHRQPAHMLLTYSPVIN